MRIMTLKRHIEIYSNGDNTMDMNSYFNSNVAVSEEAKIAAEKLIKSLQDGEIKIEILPNSYVPFSGAMEEQDYLSYCKFLKTKTGQKVLSLLEQEDE